jgi:MOSC domain-containing protein YiiM
LKNKGEIISINVSKNKGGKKKPVDEVTISEYGIEGDGHSGNWHRQVSLLSYESIKDINSKGIDARPGDFAENITTSGIDLKRLQIGDILIVRGEDGVRLEVTQIGKECPKPCRIYYLMGSCIMPQEGVFCRVLQPGKIKVGNKIIHVS